MHELGDDGRLDLEVYNEATAFTLSSLQLTTERPCADDAPWDDAIAEGRLIAQMLHQDDAFNVRVVLGELDEQEADEWVGRASWWLRIPDGVLVVAAGGEFSWGWVEDLDDDEFTHLVRVPPGDYAVDVLTMLTGVNGLPALERTDRHEPLGTWWRRTRPDEPMPPWLQFLLLEHLAEDPGHEDDWEGWSQARWSAVMDAVEHGGWIDWVIHLRPLDGPPPTDLPELDEGCFYEPEVRAPTRCPRGIAGTPVNAEAPHEPSPDEPVDVLEQVADLSPAPIHGGPVHVPLDRVELAVRLAWFADRAIDVELLLHDTDVEAWAVQHVPTDDGFVRPRPGGGVRLSFAHSEVVRDVLARLHRLGPALLAVPEGTALEVVTASEGEPTGGLRLAGRCVDGHWVVEHAWPEVHHEVLAAALDLARAVDDGHITTRSPVEADEVLRWWRDDGMQRTAPLTVDDEGRLHHGEHRRFDLLVARAVFAVRHGGTWPCVPPDDPLADLGIDPDEDLFEALAEGDFQLRLADRILEAASGRGYFRVAPDTVADEVLARTDALLDEFVALGAERIGDLACSFSPQALLRGVAHPGQGWYGIVMVAPFTGAVREAYTAFADRSSLTTTTNPFPGGAPPASGILWQALPATTSTADLVALHRAEVERHADEEGTKVVATPPDLLDLAEAIEDFLHRRTG